MDFATILCGVPGAPDSSAELKSGAGAEANCAEPFRILVVDDNSAIHEDFRKVLLPTENPALEQAEAKLFGLHQPPPICRFEVDSALQGQEALQMVTAAQAELRPYAVAFVDIRMPPGWDGIETILHLKRSAPDLQVVVCTAYSDYSWEQIIAKLGNSDSLLILKKPFDNIEVLQLANALARKWELSRAAKERLQFLDETVAQRTKELRAKEQRWRMVFNGSPDSIFVVEDGAEFPGRFIEVNDITCQRLGYTRDELLTLTPLDIDAPETIHAIPEISKRLALDKRAVWEGLHVTKSGQRIPVEINCQIFEMDGRQVHCSVVRDISERKQAEEALRQAQEQLRQSQKLEAIGQLAGGVAHDFNNLLAVIRGNTDLVLMKAPGLPVEIAEFLHQIAAASDRAANLTRQLLAFSRKQIMQADYLNLNEVVINLTKMLKRLIGENIRLECQYGDGLQAVHADAGMLEQVLVNLVVNARDAMPRGGNLTITTGLRDIDSDSVQELGGAKPGKYVSLTVTDTGIGVPQEHLPHIFEPFFTTKDIGKGTGLGLSTVYGIVKQHHGWVEVRSEVGVGATFTILLPAAELPSAKRVPAGTQDKPRGGCETVLLVEDDDSVRLLTKRLLEQYGYFVLEAASGTNALTVAASTGQRLDLLLTDIIMPGDLNGRELAEQLRERFPELRVLFTSGYSGDVLGQGSFCALPKHSRFIPKPCAPADLLKLLRELLDAAESKCEVSSFT